jgi:peroxiredoxin
VPSLRVGALVLGALALGVGAGAAAVLLVGGGGSTARTTSLARPQPVSGPPLRLSGVDVSTGETTGLGAFAGKPVVLVVWASWCRACAAQIGPLKAFTAKHDDASFLAVDTQEDAKAAQAFLARTGLDLPTLADADGRLAARAGVRELPTTFFLTADHRVASVWEGPAPLRRLRAGLALAESG